MDNITNEVTNFVGMFAALATDIPTKFNGGILWL